MLISTLVFSTRDTNIFTFFIVQTRQWSIRGANRNIEKIKKKLVEQVWGFSLASCWTLSISSELQALQHQMCRVGHWTNELTRVKCRFCTQKRYWNTTSETGLCFALGLLVGSSESRSNCFVCEQLCSVNIVLRLQEAQLVLASPHLAFKIHNRAHKVYVLLMSSDYERNEWRESIDGLKSKRESSSSNANMTWSRDGKYIVTWRGSRDGVGAESAFFCWIFCCLAQRVAREHQRTRVQTWVQLQQNFSRFSQQVCKAAMVQKRVSSAIFRPSGLVEFCVCCGRRHCRRPLSPTFTSPQTLQTITPVDCTLQLCLCCGPSLKGTPNWHPLLPASSLYGDSVLVESI